MKVKIISLAILLGSFSISVNAQWAQGGLPINRFGNSSSGGPLNQWRSFGIGNFTGNAAVPLAALHINKFFLLPTANFAPGEMIRTDANSANFSAWRMFTGATAAASNEKFVLFVPAASNNVFLQSTRGDMFFNTAGPAPAFTVLERMHITQGVGNQIGVAQPNATRVNISYGAGYAPIANPVAMLNLGFDAPQGPIGGQRPWMDVGIFTCANSDNMYVGLKNEAPGGVFGPTSNNDNMDAVINWGDNTTAPAANGPDNMRFIFTQFQNPATVNGAASVNGLEAMRITPQGAGNNTTIIFTGIGGDPILNPYSTAPSPGNTLEVNSNGATNVAGGSSGLRFTNLTAASPNTPNVANGNVLSVNANGDVVLVPGGNAGSQFFSCGSINPADQLPFNSWWELNNFNFIFGGQGTTNNNVGIGTGCSPAAKLEVFQGSTNTGSTAVRISNADPGGDGVVLNVTGAGVTHNGISSLVLGGSNTNSGIVSTAFGGSVTFGGAFKGNGASIQNTGVLGSANSTVVGSVNYGGWFSAFNTVSGTTNYGIYAECPATLPTNYAGRFQGNVAINGIGTITSGTWNASDQNLKTNIDSISNALNILEQLEPKQFYYDTLNSHNLRFSSEKQYGLIAQEVEMVLPEVVSNTTKPADYDSLGNITNPAYTYKTLNYSVFIAILIKGIQEQETKIDSLTNAMVAIQSQVNGCCSSNVRIQNPTANQTDVTLTSAESIVLNQNVPNPFAEQTTITYNLPESVTKAQLLFYDATGKLIKAVDLTERGEGQINVFANDLSNGIYSYALVVDGQIAATKRMVKTN